MSSANAVVVTGSSGGLGFATAQRFLKDGYTVFGFDFGTPARLKGSGNAEFVPFRVDVSNNESVREAVTAAAKHAPIAGLIHCAGIAEFGPDNPGHLVAPTSGQVIDNLDTIERTLRVNLGGTFIVLRHVIAAMTARDTPANEERGFIILTSSGAAFEGKPGQSAYSASKAGVIGMTLPLARELSPWAIRIATIAPGLFDTPILAETPRLPRHIPFPNRMGHPNEYAALAHHIAQNSYINAEVIRLDGGIRSAFESASPFVR
ncbi:SDR family NAD(P)-dependent oxidoreductase [Brevibacterium sp. GP-SGM9]|uniref:SDR family NAD(P)-dependent oxidoreductase n=1 Tax=unclassified Brevibacterium TaxID=2614124 RepID=UPI001E54C5B1|nr:MULTISPECIES: SDR family NAD(P)-dependent oxidoreductase [unclassified Brevibacterium]MCD1286078.1 3-hydroxyacyl-CoA dehydrogenase [Brevibacterium sp. CCUG 69071]MDK8433430.1 SDR family NAD(P)-dependent oxidoreductase [Brevibacterium sp. H-BE7]